MDKSRGQSAPEEQSYIKVKCPQYRDLVNHILECKECKAYVLGFLKGRKKVKLEIRHDILDSRIE